MTCRETGRWLAVLIVALIAALAAGCAGDDDDSGDGDEPGDDDAGDDDSGDDDDGPSELPQWLSDRPYLQDLSPWRQDIDMADPPTVPQLGCIGVGNGRVFGVIANQFPPASWHNVGGPTYQKDLKWFTDKIPALTVSGRERAPSFQSVARVRNSAVVIVTAQAWDVEWTSVNFAPHYAADPRAEQALVSVWIVRNLTAETVNSVALEITSKLGRVSGGWLHESDLGERSLDAAPLEVAAEAGETDRVLRIDLGNLAPYEERVVTLPYLFTTKDEDPAAVLGSIIAAGTDALLESTVAWWTDWASAIATVDTPDETFNDLVRGLAVSVKINQAVTGGVSEMDQYSNVWLRDTHGPSLFFPAIGLLDDYADMLDYLWGATVIEGSIRNAYSADHDVSDLPPQPDWDAMGPMGGRQRAEGPSLLVLQHENYYKATGDATTLEERYGMLRHALLDQQFVDGCLQYFSSDETFEDLMEAVFGENLLLEPDESTLSLYSSLLMIRAAGFMAEVAGMLGYEDDAALFAALSENVRQCMEDTFWMEDAGFYAVKADTATREPFPQPYEDVSTMPLWLDAVSPSAPHAVRNFETVMGLLGKSDGTLWSELAPLYNLLFFNVRKGVQTGMAHGYWLGNLDRMFHPTADEAFRRWADVFSEAGFTDEAVVVDDYSHLRVIREPFGLVGDVSSRFRSWESGVMGHALLYHLTGYDADVPEESLRLAPHLPPEWDAFSVDGLAFADGRFDLDVERTDDGRRVVLTTDDLASFDLSLRVPQDEGVSGVTVDGEALAPEDILGGDQRVRPHGRHAPPVRRARRAGRRRSRSSRTERRPRAGPRRSPARHPAVDRAAPAPPATARTRNPPGIEASRLPLTARPASR